MPRRSLFTTTLSDNRRVLLAWLVAVPAVAVMYASFFPSLKGGDIASSMRNMPDSLKQAFNLDDLASAPGYLASSAFGLLVPLLMVFFGASFGSRLVAGDEETGQLDLLLSHPVGRRSLLLQRWAAMVTWSVAIAVVVWVAMVALRSPFQLDAVSPAQFAAQCLGVGLLGVMFGALGIAVGAATGRRGTAFAVTGAVGVLSYVVNAFAGPLGIAWAAKLSAFHYYIGGSPLRNGWQWGDAGVLVASAVVVVVVGAALFTRRDLAT